MVKFKKEVKVVSIGVEGVHDDIDENPRVRWARGVGERIRAAREKHHFSQYDLAYQLGGELNTRPRGGSAPSKALISHWELARSEPSAWDLSQLAHILDVSANYLLFGREVGGTRCPYPTTEEVLEIAEGTSDVNQIERTYPLAKPIKNAIRIDIFDHSMMPRFNPESTSILIDRDRRPTPGDLVLVALPSMDEVLFRKYKPPAESRHGQPPYTLIATNEDFEPRLITDAHKPVLVGTLFEVCDMVSR
jgi:transcriptional regulator with XRE-family HTH domain